MALKSSAYRNNGEWIESYWSLWTGISDFFACIYFHFGTVNFFVFNDEMVDFMIIFKGYAMHKLKLCKSRIRNPTKPGMKLLFNKFVQYAYLKLIFFLTTLFFFHSFSVPFLFFLFFSLSLCLISLLFYIDLYCVIRVIRVMQWRTTLKMFM